MSLSLPVSFIPALIFLFFMFVPAGLILLFRNLKTKKKKSPLSLDMLRSPGESLRENIEDLTFDIITYLVFIPVVPLLMYSMATTEYLLSDKSPTT